MLQLRYLLFTLVIVYTSFITASDYTDYLKSATGIDAVAIKHELESADLKIYKIKKSYRQTDKRHTHYLYVLVKNKQVVYCGITSRYPKERLAEHKYKKKIDFEYMVAVGKFTEKGAKGVRDKEKHCVCVHPNVSNKRPTCDNAASGYGGSFKG